MHAWTVWVPPTATATLPGLEAAGHVFDGEPVGMWRALTDDDVADPDDGLDLDPELWFATLAELNDLAYGMGGSFVRATEGAGDGPLQLYVARDGGQPVACLLTLDADGDCIVDLVTTRAEARGRGLATRLLRRALADARTRGQESTTLVATAKGAPVYVRLGYRTVGPIEMWERREEPSRPASR